MNEGLCVWLRVPLAGTLSNTVVAALIKSAIFQLQDYVSNRYPTLPPPLFLQFEIVSQHLVFANCIPLILKFFNQNIMSYISAKNR